MRTQVTCESFQGQSQMGLPFRFVLGLEVAAIIGLVSACHSGRTPPFLEAAAPLEVEVVSVIESPDA